MTSFKRSLACTAALSASDPAAGHLRPTPLPETPGHSQASLGQSLVGSLLLSPGSWYAQGFASALKESVSQSCWNLNLPFRTQGKSHGGWNLAYKEWGTKRPPGPGSHKALLSITCTTDHGTKPRFSISVKLQF